MRQVLQEERKGKGQTNKHSWSQEILISSRQGRYTQTTEVNTQIPISEKDSTVHPGVLLDSFLFHPHPIHMQILLMGPLKSTSALIIVASCTPTILAQTTIFSHTDWPQSLLTSLPASPLVLIQSIPHRSQKYTPLQKPISLCHSLFSPPSNFLLHWEQNSKSASRSKELTPSGPGPHLTWFSTTLLLLYYVPAIKVFLLLFYSTNHTPCLRALVWLLALHGMFFLQTFTWLLHFLQVCL